MYYLYSNISYSIVKISILSNVNAKIYLKLVHIIIIK